MKNNWDFDLSSGDTQPMDSHIDGLGGDFDCHENDGLEYLQSTMPVDDVDPFGDEFDIQMVDLAGQTQVVDLCGDTQVVNLGGETQVLDECRTEVPVDSDGEQSGETEVLYDTQVLSDDDSAKRGNSQPSDKDTTPKTGLDKIGDGCSKEQLDTPRKGEHCSGSVRRGFTSIRAASVRASGLAARNMAFRKANKNSCSIMSDDSLQELNAEKGEKFSSRDSLDLANERTKENGLVMLDEKMNAARNENRRKTVGSSTVRKLFMDDVLSDAQQPDKRMKNNDGTGELPQFAFENELGSLSYVDSQEPGEVSQANALDFVDKFLKQNVIESDQDMVEESTLRKSQPISSLKGTHSLAKKASTKSTGCRTFKWDDNLEDEGGGEFFQKKKELFFDDVDKRPRSVKHSKKPQSLNFKSSIAVEENRDGEQPDNNRKSKGAVLSDSRLLSKNLRLNGQSPELSKASFKRNLAKDLDEGTDSISGDKQVDDASAKDFAEILDVGFDTQMAADAMETLRFAVGTSDNDCNNGNGGTKRMRKSSQKDEANKRSNLEQSIYQKGADTTDAAVFTRQPNKSRIGGKSHRQSSLSSNKHSKNVRKQLDAELIKGQPNRTRSHHKDFVTDGSENMSNVPKMVGQRKEASVQVASGFDKVDGTHGTASTGQRALKKRPMQQQDDCFTPIAHRTRKSMQLSNSKVGKSFNSSREATDVISCGSRNEGRIKAGTFKTLGKKGECLKFDLDQVRKPTNMNVRQLDQSNERLVGFPRGRRTLSKLPLASQEATTKCNISSKRLKTDSTSTSMVIKEGKEHLSSCGVEGISTSVDRNASCIQEDVVQAKTSKHSSLKRQVKNTRSLDVKGMNGSLEASPKERCQPSASASTTPVNCATPINAASPICMGDEYHKQSCRKNLVRSSLMKEISSLTAINPEVTSEVKDPRRRREMTNVRVIFSHHLDADIIKQQKKILNRLGASIASSMSDASHFITDKFVRTMNMLEAIAFGKPVVTHLWLESCGQASCFIDERNYMLRDARKEKEFGFSMPVSLTRATQHALLEGRRVLITPNTKPGREILASLVKAVHGLAVGRLGRSSLRDETFLDDILVISCEEDYEICVPFLERGAAVYSSELLLNGIVTQRLDYERHRLFTDNVRKTRSTIWLKRNNKYLPVTKEK